MIGLIGRKCGMTRIFTAAGDALPVTVMEVLPNKVTQVKTVENDGYYALQVTTGVCKRSRVNKAAAGHFAKANVAAGRGLWEFLLNAKEIEGMTTGTELTVERFLDIKKVNVTANTKGKGFAGGVKRWNFCMQDASHGNSISHRAPGSIGQNQTPGRVFKGKKMAGQMGNKRSTIKNLEIVKVDVERGLLLVKGGIPGALKSDVIITPTSKHST